mgnify:CR=1 FL=1
MKVMSIGSQKLSISNQIILNRRKICIDEKKANFRVYHTNYKIIRHPTVDWLSVKSVGFGWGNPSKPNRLEWAESQSNPTVSIKKFNTLQIEW